MQANPVTGQRHRSLRYLAAVLGICLGLAVHTAWGAESIFVWSEAEQIEVTDSEGNISTATVLSVAPDYLTDMVRVSESVDGYAVWRVLAPAEMRQEIKHSHPGAYMGTTYAEAGAVLSSLAARAMQKSNAVAAQALMDAHEGMFRRTWQDSEGKIHSGTITEFNAAKEADPTVELTSDQASVPHAGWLGVDTDASGTPIETGAE